MSVAPYFFSGGALRTAIGVGSVRSKTSLCPKSRIPSNKSRECFIFSPPFHAPIRYVSLPLGSTNTLVFSTQLLSSRAQSKDALLPRLGWLFDCRNPATALLIRIKKFLAPERKRGTTFYCSLRCLGVFNCRFQ
jgi:hypothetical protein